MSTAVNTDLLTQPFPREAVKQRQIRGKGFIDYVEGHTVIHRLNAATGNNWDFSVKEIDVRPMGEAMLVRAHVSLNIPGLGEREHVGVQLVHPNAGEDLVKGSVTDALKKCASLFGVGLELWGPDYESVGTEPTPMVQQAPQQRQPQAPQPQAPQQQAYGQGQVRPPSEKQLNYAIALAKEAGFITNGHFDQEWWVMQFGKPLDAQGYTDMEIRPLIDRLKNREIVALPPDMLDDPRDEYPGEPPY